MRTSCVFLACLLAVLLGCQDTPQRPVDAGKTAEPKTAPKKRPISRYALLIGCTKYDHLPGADLKGPGNDVELVGDLLVKKFRFPKDNIRILADHLSSSTLRPIRSNIERDFKALARLVKQGDQVVILMSGHGSQQPDDDPDNPDDPEPDGLDEVFLPSDTKKFDVKTLSLPNAIRDDELRTWLDDIRRQGASVWIIMDCCHSGSAARGVEVCRHVSPRDLIPKELLEKAASRAAANGRQSAILFDGKEDQGGIVAIYASQPHEPTIEMKLPRGATDAQWQGLLTYTMVKVINDSKATLTYNELVHRIHSVYAGEFGRLGPTPLIEGIDRHKELLGQTEWPSRSRLLVTETSNKRLKINGGVLHGLARGTILAVYPAAGTENESEILGHVKIKTASMVESFAEPCAFEGVEAREKLPLGGRCRVVHAEFGDLRIKVATAEGTTHSESTMKRLKDAEQQAPGLLQVVEDRKQADWLVMTRPDGRMSIAPAAGWSRGWDKAESVFGPSPKNDNAWLHERLSRIARAQMLLKISGRTVTRRSNWITELILGPSSIDVDVELLKLRDLKDTKGTPVKWNSDGVKLRDGDLIAIELSNQGNHSLDFTLLFIDSGFGVDVLYPQPDTVVDNRLDVGDSYRVGPIRVEGDTLGLEHMIVIAVKAEGTPVDFSWLSQPSIKRVRAMASARTAAKNSLETPLGRLFQSFLFNAANTRGMRIIDWQQVALRRITWRTTPKKGG